MSDNEIEIFQELRQPMALGEVFAKSGMFPDTKTQSQAVVKIMAGKELGLSPFQSMGSIYVVNGKLALAAQAMSGLVKRSKEYDYVIKKLDDNECILSFTKNDTEVGQSTFTIKDAAKAGLANKDNWKNYPRNMVFARALANGCRWYCPQIIQGYYTQEELEDLGETTNEPIKKEIIIEVEGNVK